MRLIYFGTASFAVPALEALHEHVVLTVSQPDRPTGRGMRLTASPVKMRAVDLGIPVETPERSRAPEFVEMLQGLNADALVVAAYGQILSRRVLESAPHGGINLHGSILPRYRGAAPIQRAIENGDRETGVTLMQMDQGMDTGDMIDIATIPIGLDETYGEVQSRLSIVAAELAAKWMPRIVAGEYPRTAQNEAEATHAPKIAKAEGDLQFTDDAARAYDRFRAFTPSPGTTIRTNAGNLKLSKVRFDSHIAEPGTIVAVSPELVVSFHNGSLIFLEIQPEGKKRTSGRDFANGARLKPGMRLN